MKMEQHQIFTHFEFTLQKWAVQLLLDYSKEQTQLVIKVVDTALSKLYGVQINVDSLAARGELKFMFPSLQELFYYLSHNFKDLQLSQKSIAFSVGIGSTLKKRQFSIELLQRQMKKQDESQMKIKMLQKRVDGFQVQLKKKDEQINLLKRQVEALNQNVLELQRSNTAGTIKQIQPHPQNPDKHEFMYLQGADGLRVRRIGSSQWVNFIDLHPIRQKTSFKIRVNRLRNRALCLGVGTKSMFGVHNYHELQFPNFDFELSQMSVDGKKIGAKSEVVNGTVLTLKCDPSANRIWWYYNSIQIGNALIPLLIQGQQLYLIAYFKNEGDQLQIWT